MSEHRWFEKSRRPHVIRATVSEALSFVGRHATDFAADCSPVRVPIIFNDKRTDWGPASSENIKKAHTHAGFMHQWVAHNRPHTGHTQHHRAWQHSHTNRGRVGWV